jgi:EAL domain-containing protein (putative c-di-GMP-specific phosphodiesterase class I)
MEASLREALNTGKVAALFQPTVNLHTRKITGFEVIPRWHDPVLGEVALERFIAIAEETGLIHSLADQMLRRACAAARSWPGYVRLSIDIYPSQLKDELLAPRVLNILEESGFHPARLEMEITESALVADMDNAQRVLGALGVAGVRIVLDNFGTGYSSLYHLRNFKLDKIKIDRSFIHSMASERASAGIVNALVGLGRGLGLTIAAEGVAGLEEEAALLKSGCEQGQGQLFSAPVGAEEASTLFAGDNTASFYLPVRR